MFSWIESYLFKLSVGVKLDGETSNFVKILGLLAHFYKIKSSHTDQCPCSTGMQDVDHLLQTCPTYNYLKQEHWQEEVDLS